MQISTVRSRMEKKMKKYDVVALGELLIDFTENGKSNQGNPLFEANPGGAPCNVLAMLPKRQHFFYSQQISIFSHTICTDTDSSIPSSSPVFLL